jgi:hypothetical protein
MPDSDDRSWEANRLLIHKELENLQLQNKAFADKLELLSTQVTTMSTHVQQLNRVLWWGLGVVGSLLVAAIWGGVQIFVKLAPLAR